MAYVPDAPAMHDLPTVTEDLAFVAALWNLDASRAIPRADALFAELGLPLAGGGRALAPSVVPGTAVLRGTGDLPMAPRALPTGSRAARRLWGRKAGPGRLCAPSRHLPAKAAICRKRPGDARRGLCLRAGGCVDR